VIALYILWPSLLSVLQAWPQLLDLDPIWFVAMFVLEAASFVCIWGLQRIALGTHAWFGVATAQLASNAFSRVVPGGAAAGGALQWRMLTDSGVDGAKVATAVTATSFISTGILFVLPLLAVPSVLLGRPVPGGLALDEVRDVLRALADDGRLVGLEVTALEDPGHAETVAALLPIHHAT